MKWPSKRDDVEPTPSERPVLIHALDGFLTAGAAPRLAATQLRTGQGEVVRRFDLDELYDYRARRPFITFRSDHYQDYDEPRLEIVPTAPPEHQRGEGFAGPVGAGYGHRLVWVFTFQRPPDEAQWGRPRYITEYGRRANSYVPSSQGVNTPAPTVAPTTVAAPAPTAPPVTEPQTPETKPAKPTKPGQQKKKP